MRWARCPLTAWPTSQCDIGSPLLSRLGVGDTGEGVARAPLPLASAIRVQATAAAVRASCAVRCDSISRTSQPRYRNTSSASSI
jgi:hypothetical protein